MVNKTPCQTSKDLKANPEQSGVMISTGTVRRTLNQPGLYGQRPRKTPLLKQRRSDYSFQGVPGRTTILVGNVLWTDETKIEIIDNAHQRFGEALNAKNTLPTVWWRFHAAVRQLFCIW